MDAQRKTRCSLDPVVPTAIAALTARREALQTLREIDALLADDSPDDSVLAKHAREAATPAPGAYSPHKERTQWRRSAAVALQKPSRPHDKKTAFVIREKARHTITPGPGAYNTQAADRVIKPRIRASSFQPGSPDGQTRVAEVLPLTELEPARADKWLSQYREPKGAVAYKPASDTVATRSREQRERLRRIRLAKTRHTRVGFYDVRYHLTERRLGAVGIVPMARSASTVQEDGQSRQAQARTRRKLRAWRVAHEPPVLSAKSPDKEIMTRLQAKKVVTVQWKRARARAVLQPSRQSCSHTKVDVRVPERCRDLVAHDMAKHTGRDIVRCQRKNRRVVTPFNGVPAKESMGRSAETPRVVSAGPRAKSVVRFDRMIGRDEFTVDASGVYLLGQDQAQELQRHRLDTQPNDEIIRKRAPAAFIPKLHAANHDERNHEGLALSPKYGLIDARARGHTFLRFDNQLDREERARQKAFRTESTPQDTHDLPAKALETRDALRFRRKDAGVGPFSKARGRDST